MRKFKEITRKAIARLRVCLVLLWNGWRYDFHAKAWKKAATIPGGDLGHAFNLVNNTNAADWLGHDPQTLQIIRLAGSLVDDRRKLWRVRFWIRRPNPATAWIYPKIDFAEKLP